MKGKLLYLLLLTMTLSNCQEEMKEEESMSSRCKCAKHALHQMQRALHSYTSQSNKDNSPELDDVIDQITEIAHNCTSQRRCKCPEGYFKTSDGYHCLKVSRESVHCAEATQACSRDRNARLAIAKDHVRLTNLADEIRHIEDEDSEDYYWIGLSYNRTDGGFPIWTWEDGSTASYNLTSSLRTPVRKSMLRVDRDETQTVERVAISKNYHGSHWKQEICGRSGKNRQMMRHKYICEFVMFNLEIKAVTSHSSQGVALGSHTTRTEDFATS